VAAAVIAAEGVADTGVFLGRLLRLDPRAVVRLRPVHRAIVDDFRGHDPGDHPRSGQWVELWGMVPFGVLVMRTVAAAGTAADHTVGAQALQATLADPAAPAPAPEDARWRWAMPPSRGDVVDTVPAAVVDRVAEAAARTLRVAATEGLGGRAVGERVVRDALLDHVPIVVTGETGKRVDVPQRMVQAVVRMGFLGPSEGITSGDNLVTVRLATGWIGLDASYGSAWYRPSSPLRFA
jgi:hypothetical protein